MAHRHGDDHIEEHASQLAQERKEVSGPVGVGVEGKPTEHANAITGVLYAFFSLS